MPSPRAPIPLLPTPSRPGEAADWTGVFRWLAVLATFLAYLPLMDNQFVEWDDISHIVENPCIRHLDLASLQWMFTHFYVGNWIPLTWLSFSLDYWVGRLEPWVYHLDNLILFSVSVLLVFEISRRLMKVIVKNEKGEGIKILGTAFGAALLFGLHPMHVESVAWATERKDVLYGVFYLTALWVYLDHGVQPRPWKIGTCLGLYVLALMSKPMAITLPFVFLLLDYWPLGRLSLDRRKALLEKIPFLLVILVSAAVTVASQSDYKAEVSLTDVPLLPRLTNAAHSVFFYLLHLAWPLDLVAYYPIRFDEVYSASYLFCVVLLLALSVLCFLYRKKFSYLFVIWSYYLGTLLPVLGIVLVGNQGAADRFAYLPSLGFLFLLSAGLVAFFSRQRGILIGLALGGAVLLGGLTWQQISYWKDTAALWKHVLHCYPRNNYIANHNLGEVYEGEGRLEEAFAQYAIVIQNSPQVTNAYYGEARIYAKKGRLDDSIAEYKAALQIDPSHKELYPDLALVYQKKGMGKQALETALEAVRLDPGFPKGYEALGQVLRDQGRDMESLEALRKAWILASEDPTYFRELLKACQKAHQYKEALGYYQMLSNDPRSALTMRF